VHLGRPEKEVRTVIVAREKSESVRMSLYAAVQQVHLGSDQYRVATVADDLPVALHAGKPLAQRQQVLRRRVERLRERLFRERYALAVQRLEDFLAGRRAAAARPRASTAARRKLGLLIVVSFDRAGAFR
jgi:hypothetical protein